MNSTRAEAAAGCLYIDSITSGASNASGLSLFTGLPGLETRPFHRTKGMGLWEGLQTALWEVREACRGAVAVAAWDTGCAAAIALAEQLPVDRLVLVEPRLTLHASGRGQHWGEDMPYGQARRIMAFARRNLPMCVSEVMVIGSAAFPPVGWPLRGGFRQLYIEGDIGEDLCTIRENTVKQAISCFLHTGELPKPLAENSEMCIIYG